MRYLIVACKVFEKEIRRFLEDTLEHSLLLLEFGYHRTPSLLQAKVQDIINTSEGVDAILLLYGYCAGTLRIKPGRIPVVMPRAHDCFDIMLGSERRQSLFVEEPGTYFLSDGWVSEDGTPLEKISYMKEILRSRDDSIIKETYAGYKRLLFVRTGTETKVSLTRAKKASDLMNWRFQVCDADMSMMKRLLAGEWDEDFIELKNDRDEEYYGHLKAGC
jgi:hypothetical protein